jgi:hypothetical protein
MARAIMQRWPMTENVRKAVIAKLVNVLTDPASSKREIISAAKALMSAEQQNQSDEHKVVDIGTAQQRNDRLAGIAADLGLDPDVVLTIEGQASGGVASPRPVTARDDDDRGAGPRPIEETRRADEGGGHRDPGPGEHGEA